MYITISKRSGKIWIKNTLKEQETHGINDTYFKNFDKDVAFTTSCSPHNSECNH